MGIYVGRIASMRAYDVQKEIARKHLLRAKESRGTDSYKGAWKRAQYEMSVLQKSAVLNGINHKNDIFRL